MRPEIYIDLLLNEIKMATIKINKNIRLKPKDSKSTSLDKQP